MTTYMDASSLIYLSIVNVLVQPQLMRMIMIMITSRMQVSSRKHGPSRNVNMLERDLTEDIAYLEWYIHIYMCHSSCIVSCIIVMCACASYLMVMVDMVHHVIVKILLI